MIRSSALFQNSAGDGFDSAGSLFAALGDPTRLTLISRLCTGGPMSITKLSEGFDVTRQAITKHLRVMEDSGLVQSAKQGRETIWELEQNRLLEARLYLEIISKQWDNTLLRLREFVENDARER